MLILMEIFEPFWNISKGFTIVKNYWRCQTNLWVAGVQTPAFPRQQINFDPTLYPVHIFMLFLWLLTNVHENDVQTKMIFLYLCTKLNQRIQIFNSRFCLSNFILYVSELTTVRGTSVYTAVL